MNATGNSPYAYSFAHIVITQSSYSLSELTDIDPFDPAALLGNIGGFWGERSRALPERGRFACVFVVLENSF